MSRMVDVGILRTKSNIELQARYRNPNIFVCKQSSIFNIVYNLSKYLNKKDPSYKTKSIFFTLCHFAFIGLSVARSRCSSPKTMKVN